MLRDQGPAEIRGAGCGDRAALGNLSDLGVYLQASREFRGGAVDRQVFSHSGCGGLGKGWNVTRRGPVEKTGGSGGTEEAVPQAPLQEECQLQGPTVPPDPRPLSLLNCGLSEGRGASLSLFPHLSTQMVSLSGPCKVITLHPPAPPCRRGSAEGKTYFD